MGRRANRGKRYSDEQKLNYTKVLAIFIAILVIVIFCLAIKELLTLDFSDTKELKYYAVYSENKWGVIDSNAKSVIAPSYAEMIIIPDNSKDIFLCTYDIDVQTGEYKTKALNADNKQIYTEYEQIEAIENYDKSQNIWYEQNVLKVKQNGNYGLIDLQGKQILECKYDDIYALNGIENSLIVKKDGNTGLVDCTGREMIATSYKEIKNLGETYSEGFITIDNDGKYGVIAYSQEQKLKNQYEYIEQIYGNNLYVITQNGSQKLINNQGQILLETGYDKITQITQNGENVVFVKNDLYGLMSVSGEIIIKPEYQELNEINNGYFMAKKGTQYGVIDVQNNVKLYFGYLSISYNKQAGLYIAEDIDFKSSIIDKNFEVKLIGVLSDFNEEENYIRMRVDNQYKYYNLKCEEISNVQALKNNTIFLSQKDGKYGYVDADGKVVVDYIYDDATEQNSAGYVAVKKNGLWGSLDRKGKEVIEPKYELSENVVIDFIGKWHLGQDLNMNYYCEK